jgi:hypothetical protein
MDDNLMMDKPGVKLLRDALKTSPIYPFPSTNPKPLLLLGKLHILGDKGLYVLDESGWSKRGDLPFPLDRCCPPAVLEDKLYVVDGLDNNFFYCYDPLTNEWTSLRPPSYRHRDGACFEFNHTIAVLGGEGGSIMETYDADTGRWRARRFNASSSGWGRFFRRH